MNSEALPSRVHFSKPFVLTCRVVIVWLMKYVSDPSPSGQLYVAPSMGGVDSDIRGIKNFTEPSGALRRTTVHHELKLA